MAARLECSVQLHSEFCGLPLYSDKHLRVSMADPLERRVHLHCKFYGWPPYSVART